MQVPHEIPSRTRSGRHAVVRRSTRGPLDDQDPLSASNSPIPTSASPVPSPPSTQTSPRPLTSPSLLSPTIPPLHPSSPHTSPDLPFLRAPKSYHPLPTPLPPFTTPSHQPPKGSTLPQLVAAHHFRHAAIKAASDLCTGLVPPEQVLETFHVRLACLILCGHADIAAAEAKPLGDWIARQVSLRSPASPLPQGQSGRATGGVLEAVPWGLRLLVQKLGGAGDGRKNVMGLFALGQECRANVRAAEGAEEREVWEERLLELGVRVAGELVEMGEVVAAERQLEGLSAGLKTGEGGMEGREEDLRALRGRMALLYVRIGDVDAAEKVILDMGDEEKGTGQEVLRALVLFARGNHDAATEALRLLYERDETDALVANNHAVCLLYSGKIDEASTVLERLVADNRPTSAALFNLATMYELSTDRAIDKKAQLVEQVASKGPEDGGWERLGADFKL